MGSEELGHRGDAYHDTGGGTGVGKEEGIQSGDKNRLLGRNVPVANKTLETNPHAPFAYATQLGKYHPNISILGGHEGKLERER